MRMTFGKKPMKNGRALGFSLVELMIALVVGLLITLGAFQLFVVSKKSFDHSLAILERQESLRFLVDSISYDVRSSASTDMLEPDGSLLSDGETLSLTFNRENSICSDDSYTLKYYQPVGEENTIFVESSCGGTVVDEPVVLGVGVIEFSYISFGLGVRATITMVDDLGRIDDQVFHFTIANRSAVGRALELWGDET
ncbi:PilW family protein [Halomonas lysinitropha]|uniref:Prepilin-type N-terminal cleavage/methylation domain-containing protein n=1 Tax=Halomonas lysinitropha TaxID=2607506 RepID=A0A5K1I3J5_9GAMM|nr:prepilin-type N-terminal cleavage/methylation domain-containing protein [Halomonas lysinitropha]VVZ94603.1 hypothetical protein HALO32_00656 [Halomonas lysinitropha]